MKIYERLADILSALDAVEGVALSGSSTALIKDELSDYDIYVYCSSPIPRNIRKEIFAPLGKAIVGSSPFEEGDMIIPEDDVPMDIMYRDMKWIEDQIEDVWEKCNPRLGYTTCFIFNVKNSRVLFDRQGKLKKLIRRCSSPYPEKLRENIIAHNLQMIDDSHLYNFRDQIHTAAKRGDIVSINHRIAAYLASCFDILFAYSEELHPGEKKLLDYTKALGLTTPQDFESDIKCLLSEQNTQSLPALIDKMTADLKTMLES